MNKTFKTSQIASPTINQKQQSQDLDLRLNRQINITAKYQKQWNQRKIQIQYCTQFLNKLKDKYQIIKQNYLLNKNSKFGGWESKIKQLIVSAITNQESQNQKINKGYKLKSTRQAACSQKKHLHQILDDKKIKQEEEEIIKLEAKLNGLHSKIQAMVMQEYMNDKIINKIKKQSRRATKLKTIQYLEKQISKYKNWVHQNNKKVNNETIVKEIKDKIMLNLQLMKQLMNKKVANNDFIYQQFEQKKNQNTITIDKIDNIQKKIYQHYLSSIENIKQTGSIINHRKQNQNVLNKQQKTQKSMKIEHIKGYFIQIQMQLKQLDEYPFQQEITSKCHQLNKKLDEIKSRSKK